MAESSDEGELCPVCAEEMTADDLRFLPCPCGFQVCVWCFHKIKETGNGRCPGCRLQYEDGNIKFQDLKQVLAQQAEKMRQAKAQAASKAAARQHRLQQQQQQQQQSRKSSPPPPGSYAARVSGGATGSGRSAAGKGPRAGGRGRAMAGKAAPSSMPGGGGPSGGGPSGGGSVAGTAVVARTGRKAGKKAAAVGNGGSVPGSVAGSVAGSVGSKGGKRGAGSSSGAVSRRDLANVRVVQRNLVYVVGLAPSIAREEILRRDAYFGQYGRIVKVVVNRNSGSSGHYGQGSGAGGKGSASAYVTYAGEKGAVAAIRAVDGVVLSGRTLRASFGTTKYCNQFLRGQSCSNRECLYLHQLGPEDVSFTKQEMQAGGGSTAFHELTHLPLEPDGDPGVADGGATASAAPVAAPPSVHGVTSAGPQGHHRAGDGSTESEAPGNAWVAAAASGVVAGRAGTGRGKGKGKRGAGAATSGAPPGGAASSFQQDFPSLAASVTSQAAPDSSAPREHRSRRGGKGGRSGDSSAHHAQHTARSEGMQAAAGAAGFDHSANVRTGDSWPGLGLSLAATSDDPLHTTRVPAGGVPGAGVPGAVVPGAGGSLLFPSRAHGGTAQQGTRTGAYFDDTAAVPPLGAAGTAPGTLLGVDADFLSNTAAASRGGGSRYSFAHAEASHTNGGHAGALGAMWGIGGGGDAAARNGGSGSVANSGVGVSAGLGLGVALGAVPGATTASSAALSGGTGSGGGLGLGLGFDGQHGFTGLGGHGMGSAAPPSSGVGGAAGSGLGLGLGLGLGDGSDPRAWLRSVLPTVNVTFTGDDDGPQGGSIADAASGVGSAGGTGDGLGWLGLAGRSAPPQQRLSLDLTTPHGGRGSRGLSSPTTPVSPLLNATPAAAMWAPTPTADGVGLGLSSPTTRVRQLRPDPSSMSGADMAGWNNHQPTAHGVPPGDLFSLGAAAASQSGVPPGVGLDSLAAHGSVRASSGGRDGWSSAGGHGMHEPGADAAPLLSNVLDGDLTVSLLRPMDDDGVDGRGNTSARSAHGRGDSSVHGRYPHGTGTGAAARADHGASGSGSGNSGLGAGTGTRSNNNSSKPAGSSSKRGGAKARARGGGVAGSGQGGGAHGAKKKGGKAKGRWGAAGSGSGSGTNGAVITAVSVPPPPPHATGAPGFAAPSVPRPVSAVVVKKSTPGAGSWQAQAAGVAQNHGGRSGAGGGAVGGPGLRSRGGGNSGGRGKPRGKRHGPPSPQRPSAWGTTTSAPVPAPGSHTHVHTNGTTLASGSHAHTNGGDGGRRGQHPPVPAGAAAGSAAGVASAGNGSGSGGGGGGGRHRGRKHRRGGGAAGKAKAAAASAAANSGVTGAGNAGAVVGGSNKASGSRGKAGRRRAGGGVGKSGAASAGGSTSGSSRGARGHRSKGKH